jgi:hypothetical protein
MSPVSHCHQCLVHCKRFEVEVNLRPSVSRPVCPGVRRPSGTYDKFFFLLEISFRQLRLCYFVAPFLTKGRVCNLLEQLLLSLARAVTLGSKSCRTHGHILLSHLRRPTWRARFPYLYPTGTGWPSYSPGHWVAFLSPLTTCRDYGGGIITRLHTAAKDFKFKLIYDRQSVGQSVLVLGTHLGPLTNIFSLLEIFFRQLQVC